MDNILIKTLKFGNKKVQAEISVCDGNSDISWLEEWQITIVYYRLIEALETAQLNGVFKIAGVRAKWEVKKLNSSEKLANHSQIMMKVEVDSLIAKKSEPIVVKKDNKSVVHEEQLDLPGPSCSSSKFLLPTKRQHQTNVQPYNSGSESDPSEYSKEELLVAAIGPKSSSNQIQYMGEKNNTLIKTNLSKLFAKSSLTKANVTSEEPTTKEIIKEKPKKEAKKYIEVPAKVPAVTTKVKSNKKEKSCNSLRKSPISTRSLNK